MSFKFIRPVADGNLQYILSRQIEEPDSIVFTDTPSNGETGLWDGHLTGSRQSMEFEIIDDELISLINDSGNGTEILLDGIGQNSSTAQDLMFEGWMKIRSGAHLPGDVIQWFDLTIQRNELQSTVGFDGIYSNRAVLVDPDGDSTSGWYLDFQYALSSDIAYSCTSDVAITEDVWHHVMTSYTSGDPFSTGLMSIYIDGSLHKQVSMNDLETWANGNTFQLPPTAQPLAIRNGITWRGNLDELRLWINTSGSPGSINTLASVTSLGLSPEQMNGEVIDIFAPSGSKMAAWWRFETVSAYQVFSSVPGSIIDSTTYGHDGTPYNFEGATEFSDEQHAIFGGASAFPLLRTGIADSGGLLVVDNLNTTITLEEGVDNLVLSTNNIWNTIGNATSEVDNRQIWVGSSGVKVKTQSAGDGIFHSFDYSDFLYDNNTYTCSFRLLSTSGSVSAEVSFHLGHIDNVVTTTALMNNQYWTPAIIRNSVCADIAQSTITGMITVKQLHDGVGTDNGSKYNLDGLLIKEGDYPPSFVAPNYVRKGGQIYWRIID